MLQMWQLKCSEIRSCMAFDRLILLNPNSKIHTWILRLMMSLLYHSCTVICIKVLPKLCLVLYLN